MGVSTSADPANHCYTNPRKGDSHPVHYNDPTRTRTYIPAPLPQPAVHLPAHIRSLAFHWLLHQPARTLSGINTPHIPSPVIIHPPAYEDGNDSVPKRRLLELRRRGITQKKTLHIEHGESLKSRRFSTCFPSLTRHSQTGSQADQICPYLLGVSTINSVTSSQPLYNLSPQLQHPLFPLSNTPQYLSRWVHINCQLPTCRYKTHDAILVKGKPLPYYLPFTFFI